MRRSALQRKPSKGKLPVIKKISLVYICVRKKKRLKITTGGDKRSQYKSFYAPSSINQTTFLCDKILTNMHKKGTRDKLIIFLQFSDLIENRNYSIKLLGESHSSIAEDIVMRESVALGITTRIFL